MEEEELFDPNTLRVMDMNRAKVNTSGKCVIYWMENSQRAQNNLALNLAIEKANELRLPVVVFFGLTEKYPEANVRSYYFMLSGLKETAEELRRRRIKFVMRKVSPNQGIVKLASELKAALVVVDDNHLRHGRKWRDAAAEKLGVKLLLVDGDVIVPIRLIGKDEYGERTLRPRIEKKLKEFLTKIPEISPGVPSDRMKVKGVSLDREDLIALFKGLKIDRSVSLSKHFKGGRQEARRRLKQFIKKGLPGYKTKRDDASLDITSHLSPYLKFGQISVHAVALEIAAAGVSGDDKSAFLETLIVRRELAENFTFYNKNYDSIKCGPQWARNTLKKHSFDQRPQVYSRGKLEAAATSDALWNACMKEMVITGYMHEYLRGYWAKKILEWSETPEDAYKTALYLNNKYFIDGRCPNAYTNIAWAITGRYDNPFPEQPIFGRVRSIAAGDAKKKFDYGKYIARINGYEKESSSGTRSGKNSRKNSGRGNARKRNNRRRIRTKK